MFRNRSEHEKFSILKTVSNPSAVRTRENVFSSSDCNYRSNQGERETEDS